MQKAVANLHQKTLQQQFEIMLQQLSATQTSKQIVLKDLDKTYLVNIKDIIYCKAEGAYTQFYIIPNQTILVSHNLRSYEELLEPAGFIRTHNAFLVNPNCIKVFDRKTDGGILILDEGHNVPVSQRKKEVVLDFLEKKRV